MTKKEDFEKEKKAVRIGYIGSESSHSWKGRYKSLDGVMRKTISPKNKVLQINTETLSGSLTVEIYNNDDEKLFGERITENKSFTVDPADKMKIKIIGENHSGSFEIF